MVLADMVGEDGVGYHEGHGLALAEDEAEAGIPGGGVQGMQEEKWQLLDKKREEKDIRC